MQKSILLGLLALAACTPPALVLPSGEAASALELNVCYAWGPQAGPNDETPLYFRRADGRLVFASMRNIHEGKPDSECDVFVRFDQGRARSAARGAELISFQPYPDSAALPDVARNLYLAMKRNQNQLFAERAYWEAQNLSMQKPAAAPQAIPAPAPALRSKRAGSVLAVLELRNKLPAAESRLVDVAYFSDQVRAAALKSTPGLHVITRENLLVLLEASGKRIEECEGECEVETGRRIGADLVISGEVLRVGNSFKLNLKIHDTQAGRLIDGEVAAGKTVEELDAATAHAVQALMSPQEQ